MQAERCMYLMLSSTVEGLLAVHNLCHDKDHEQMLALQQMCAEKDAVTDQDKIATENCISLLAKKKVKYTFCPGCHRRSTRSFAVWQSQRGDI